MQTVCRAMAVGIAVCALYVPTSFAAEEKIEPSALPQQTFDALRARFPGMTFVSVAKETDPQGKLVFDVELKVKGRKFETDIKSDGTMLEVEKEVTKGSWPKALNSTVQSKFAKSKIKEVMEVDKVNGKKEVPDHLEVTVQTAGDKDEELLVTLDGKELTKEAVPQPAASAGGDEEIKPQELPKAVTSALRKKFPGAKIKSAEKGTEDGKPIFEASINSKQHNVDVTLSPDGKILSFEKEVFPSEMPKATASSLAAKYPHATITIAEEVWENDKMTGYEATIVTTDKKKVDVTFDRAGKLVEDTKK